MEFTTFPFSLNWYLFLFTLSKYNIIVWHMWKLFLELGRKDKWSTMCCFVIFNHAYCLHLLWILNYDHYITQKFLTMSLIPPTTYFICTGSPIYWYITISHAWYDIERKYGAVAHWYWYAKPLVFYHIALFYWINIFGSRYILWAFLCVIP